LSKCGYPRVQINEFLLERIGGGGALAFSDYPEFVKPFTAGMLERILKQNF
jgi:hypothetical protein